jgi:hypothetical protein
VYNCFLTGIYNFRTTELLDMRRVPFLAKFLLSSGIAFYMCSKLWDSNVYEADLYQVALRYREKYDKDWKPEMSYGEQQTNNEEPNNKL